MYYLKCIFVLKFFMSVNSLTRYLIGLQFCGRKESGEVYSNITLNATIQIILRYSPFTKPLKVQWVTNLPSIGRYEIHHKH